MQRMLKRPRCHLRSRRVIKNRKMSQQISVCINSWLRAASIAFYAARFMKTSTRWVATGRGAALKID